jgi:hypothetical protein
MTKNSQKSTFLVRQLDAHGLCFLELILVKPEKLQVIGHNDIKMCPFKFEAVTNDQQIFIQHPIRLVVLDQLIVEIALGDKLAIEQKAADNHEDFDHSQDVTYRGFLKHDGTRVAPHHDVPLEVELSTALDQGQLEVALLQAGFHLKKQTVDFL